MSSLPSRSCPLRRLTGYPAAIAITLLFYTLALLASRSNSATFDEGAHLAGGYIHLTLGQPRIHTENGYLSQALAALPLLITRPAPPSTTSHAFQHAESFLLGRDFLFHSGNNPDQLLLLGRAMIGLLTSITALTVYAWSRKLFSPPVAICSLLQFLLAPLVLSHGFLITSDMPATCFFMLSLAAFLWTLDSITPLRFALCALALAALFLSKMSAPLILPLLFTLALIHTLTPAASGSAGRRALRNTGLLLAQALTVYLLLWSAYGFTYSAFKDSPPDSGQMFSPTGQWTWALHNPGLLLQCIAFARDHHLLPESYLYGYAYVAQTTRLVITYANGTISRAGWWWFYPFVFAITTPIPILLLTLAGPFALRQRRAADLKPLLLRVAPLLLWIVFYGLCAILSYRGSGPRHLLPIYPALCILLGAVCVSLRRIPYGSALIALLFAWLAIENLLVAPHYLSYMNELAGGPKNGYRHLVDSAVDWGQDLPALRDFLNQPDIRTVPAYLSYFGTAEPAAYGIHATPLPSFIPLSSASPPNPADPVQPLTPGLYCISVTLLENLYNNFGSNYGPDTERAYTELRTVLPARDDALQHATLLPAQRQYLENAPALFQSARLARLCAYLQKRTPLAQAGYSINIYAVTAEDLDAALNGPPPFAGNAP